MTDRLEQWPALMHCVFAPPHVCRTHGSTRGKWEYGSRIEVWESHMSMRVSCEYMSQESHVNLGVTSESGSRIGGRGVTSEYNSYIWKYTTYRGVHDSQRSTRPTREYTIHTKVYELHNTQDWLSQEVISTASSASALCHWEDFSIEKHLFVGIYYLSF